MDASDDATICCLISVVVFRVLCVDLHSFHGYEECVNDDTFIICGCDVVYHL